MNLKPTVEDCWSMVHTGSCRVESNKFDKCEIYEVPDPKYNWMNENVLQGYDCGFFKFGIIADKIDSEIFYEKRCKANAFKCETENSILVWNSTVIS